MILVAIPFSVYIAQKRQQTTSNAAKSTRLFFNPTSTTAIVGGIINLDIMLDPGSNLVSFVKLSISYDPSKFATASGGLAINQVSNTLDTPIDEVTYQPGKATISMSIGADPTKAIVAETKIATLQLQALATTTSTTGTVNFDSDPYTQVLSIASVDKTNENVLSSGNPATIIVTGAPSVSPTPTGSPTSSSSPSVPACTGLSVDRSTTGTAPYSVTFTAAGTDSNGNISNVSFNFGDGAVQSLTTGGGIGTNSVNNVQISHTYNNSGTFTAYAILTDSNNNSSTEQDICSQDITINSASSTGGTTISPTATPTATTAPTLIPSPTAAPTVLPPTGPGEKILGVGVLGIIFTAIGGALFAL